MSPCARGIQGCGVEVKKGEGRGRGRGRGGGGGIGRGEGRGDNRGTACLCKWCHAINPGVFSCLCLNSSVVMLNMNPSPPRPDGAWRGLTGPEGAPGLSCPFLQLIYCRSLPRERRRGAGLDRERRRVGEMEKFLPNRRYLAQVLLLGKLKPPMIVCCLSKKEPGPLKCCEEICN